MSILIKGMKMPAAGAYICALGVIDENTATLTIHTPINESQRSYKLVTIPTHGDLIDRDGLRQEMRLSDSCKRCERDAYKCQYYDEMTVMDVCGIIDDLPVVIPAERGEE